MLARPPTGAPLPPSRLPLQQAGTRALEAEYDNMSSSNHEVQEHGILVTAYSPLGSPHTHGYFRRGQDVPLLMQARACTSSLGQERACGPALQELCGRCKAVGAYMPLDLPPLFHCLRQECWAAPVKFDARCHAG